MAAADELLCPECRNPFSLNGRVPKTLQCLHTFCILCLQLDHTDEGKPFVSCPAPLCGTRHFLDAGGKDLESGLKTDYFIERASSRFQVLSRADARCDTCSEPDNEAIVYCDSCRKLLCQVCSDFHKRNNDTRPHRPVDVKKLLQEPKADDDPLAPFTTNKKWKCEGHTDDEPPEDVAIYCLTCGAMICSLCAMSVHAQHTMRKASQVLSNKEYSEYQFEQLLPALEQARDQYAAALDTTNERIEEFDRAHRVASKAIEQTTDELRLQLSAERDALMKKIERIHDARVNEITKELERFNKLRVDISHSISRVNNTLLCVPEDILEQEQDLIERLEQLRHEFDELPKSPSQRDVFVPTMDPVDLSGKVGQVRTNPELSSLTKDIDKLALVQGKETELVLVCHDSVGSTLLSTDFEVVPVEVRPAAEMFTVVKNLDGTFTMTLMPRSSGEHLIKFDVLIKGIMLTLDPVTVIVSPALLEEAEIEKVIEFDEIPEMISPAGIAILAQRAVIADRDAHKLFVITLEGECLKVIGRNGEGGGEFNSPQGVDWWGENLVVADTENNRIQVLSTDGVCLNVFGRLGGQGSEFMLPTDVAMSVCQGCTTMYVADSVNHRVQFFKMTDFEANGELMGVYTMQHKPQSLCVSGQGQVFVTENLVNRFSILSHKRVNKSESESDEQESPEPQNKYLTELELLKTCTRQETLNEEPIPVQDIAYDLQSQYILTTEQDSSSIFVFCRDGTYVGSVPCPEGAVLERIAAFDSCVLVCDSAARAFLVVKLF